MTEQEIGWDEAVSAGGYVSLEEGKEKRLGVTNWEFEKVDKFGKEAIEFKSEVVWEDDEALPNDGEKLFTTMSSRLKKKLRPLFEDKDNTATVYFSVIRVGEQFNTQYSVKELEKPTK